MSPPRKRHGRGRAVVEADLRACWANLEAGCRRTPGAVALRRAAGASPAQVQQFLDDCLHATEVERLAFAEVAAELLHKLLPPGTRPIDVRAALGLRDS